MPHHCNDRVAVPQVRKLVRQQGRHCLGISLLHYSASNDDQASGGRSRHEVADVQSDNLDPGPKCGIEPEQQLPNRFFAAFASAPLRSVLRNRPVDEAMLQCWRDCLGNPL